MTDKYINLNELSITTQALLKKINEQAELKVDKDEVVSASQNGDLIATIGDVDIYNGISGSFVEDVFVGQDSVVSSGVAYIDPSLGKQVQVIECVLGLAQTIYANKLRNSSFKGVGLIYVASSSISGSSESYIRTTNLDRLMIDGSQFYIAGGNVYDEQGNMKSGDDRQRLYGGRFYLFTYDNSDVLKFYELDIAKGSDVPTSVSELTNDSGYQTASQVNTLIGTAIGNINQFNVAIVQTLPTTNIDAHTIYFVPQQNAQTANSYEEWMYINSQWEMIGTTSIDLSGYVPTSRTVNGKALSSDISLDYQDVGALSSSTAIPDSTSDLTNDSDFQTSTQVSSAISAEAGKLIPYGYCTTAAGTVEKTVTVSPAITQITTGTTIAVKFQYANTGSNPTLNVNSLGAIAIKRYGTTAAGTSAAANWNANSVVLLVYDGTYWQLADWNNTTYSGMTDAEYQAGTSTSNKLITPARLKAAIQYYSPANTSDLTNDSGFITSADIPVTDVQNSSGTSLVSNGVATIPDSSAYILTYGGTVTYSEVVAAYNANRPIYVKYTDPEEGDLLYYPVIDLYSSGNYQQIDCGQNVGIINAGGQQTVRQSYVSWNTTTGWYIHTDSIQIPTVPTNVSSFTNDAGYLTLSTLPIYDGTVI